MVAVGQELATRAAVLDSHHAGLDQVPHRPIHGVDGPAHSSGQRRPSRHAVPGPVAIAQQQRVEPEGAVRDVGVDHPLRHDREPLFLDQQRPLVADIGTGRIVIRGGIQLVRWV
ncbi:hypothetical protein [Angustibacter luteus]|uniref:Uncharacterized protein n=1 Tax=Angustibacter luteus TaxID=658456 RepID=A0ABW1JFN6_9ACTN